MHGTFNVAGDGLITLSQALRRLGRVTVPLPRVAMTSLGSAVRQTRLGLPDYSPEQVDFLTYGRGVDTTRMRTVLGFEPRYTTEQALQEFATSLAPGLLQNHPWSPWRPSCPERWEARVADAEIIPLGTRGRPGRGSGRDKPSASSRNLAGSARRSAAEAAEAAEQTETPETEAPETEATADGAAAEQRGHDTFDTFDAAVEHATDAVTPAADAAAFAERPVVGLPDGAVPDAASSGGTGRPHTGSAVAVTSEGAGRRSARSPCTTCSSRHHHGPGRLRGRANR